MVFYLLIALHPLAFPNNFRLLIMNVHFQKDLKQWLQESRRKLKEEEVGGEAKRQELWVRQRSCVFTLANCTAWLQDKLVEPSKHGLYVDLFIYSGNIDWARTLCLIREGNAPHSSTLAWKIPWAEEPGKLQSMGSQRVRHDWATSHSLFTFRNWRRKWQPTPVFLPGESHGWGSLVGCPLWGRKESNMTEAT